MLNFMLSIVLVFSTLSLPKADVLAQQLVDSAQSNEIDPVLWAALVYHESRFDSRRLSSRGAFGLAQLHPAYHADVRRKGDWANLYRGATVFAGLLQECLQPRRAVAAYRLGHCANGSRETDKVMRTYRQWSWRWRAYSSLPATIVDDR